MLKYIYIFLTILFCGCATTSPRNQTNWVPKKGEVFDIQYWAEVRDDGIYDCVRTSPSPVKMFTGVAICLLREGDQ